MDSMHIALLYSHDYKLLYASTGYLDDACKRVPFPKKKMPTMTSKVGHLCLSVNQGFGHPGLRQMETNSLTCGCVCVSLLEGTPFVMGAYRKKDKPMLVLKMFPTTLPGMPLRINVDPFVCSGVIGVPFRFRLVKCPFTRAI